MSLHHGKYIQTEVLSDWGPDLTEFPDVPAGWVPIGFRQYKDNRKTILPRWNDQDEKSIGHYMKKVEKSKGFMVTKRMKESGMVYEWLYYKPKESQ